jgi:hypothetical protein
MHQATMPQPPSGAGFCVQRVGSWGRQAGQSAILIVLLLCGAAVLFTLVPVRQRLTTGEGRPGTLTGIAQVQAGLLRDPNRWLGRDLWVRGIGMACITYLNGSGSPCVTPQPSLLDPASPSLAPLPITAAAASPALRLLRGLPLLGTRVPAAPTLQFGVLATYHIRIEPVDTHGLAPSNVARLLDVGQ